MSRIDKNRVGERRIMNCGEECEIVEYNSSINITVRFIKSGELVKCQYSQFEKGNIKSHFTPTVYGVGIVGLEKTRGKNGNKFKSYEIWRSMLERCYDKKSIQKYSTYVDCTICNDWLYYPNFKKWYEENYYEIEGQRMDLDKDILSKGNKIYSPETCVFVPQNINILFTKRQNDRGKYPIGASWNKQNKKYRAQCNIFDFESGKTKKKGLGYYNTPEEAFEAYKKTKEKIIKVAADYYKDRIPEKLYEAMYRYEVHITD